MTEMVSIWIYPRCSIADRVADVASPDCFGGGNRCECSTSFLASCKESDSGIGQV